MDRFYYSFSDFEFLHFMIAKDYGLFLADEDPKKGIWLEPGRNLGYYVLRTGVCKSLSGFTQPFLNIISYSKID